MTVPFSEVKKALYTPPYRNGQGRVSIKKDVSWGVVNKRFEKVDLKEVENDRKV